MQTTISMPWTFRSVGGGLSLCKSLIEFMKEGLKWKWENELYS